MKETLINTIPFQDATYRIGTEGFNFNAYSFDQVGDACGNLYEVKFKINGLPSMVTHNEDMRRFDVAQSFNVEEIGIRTVFVEAWIEVPKDKRKVDIVKFQDQFKIQIDPCEVDSMTGSIIGQDSFDITIGKTEGEPLTQLAEFDLAMDLNCGYA